MKPVSTSASTSSEPVSVQLDFDDNRLLPMLYGAHDKHLAQIEQRLGVSLASRGNQLVITGPAETADAADAGTGDADVSDTEASAPVCLTASATVSNTGTLSTDSPPLPGVTPATICVPYSRQFLV